MKRSGYDSAIAMPAARPRQRRDARAGSLAVRSGAGRRTAGFLAVKADIVIALLAGLAIAALTEAAEPDAAWQALEDITAVAEGFVRDELANADQAVEPRAGALDPRLKLARCEQPLEAFLQDGARLTGRTVVGVRCAGDKPWKIYVPIQVAVTDTVLTASRTLPRGHVLTAGDLVAEQRDVSRLAGGYLTRADDLVGRRLRQQLGVGRVLTPSLIEADILVKRGQSVTITAQGETIRIDMAGTALSDGSLNERIRIRNDQSGRVVEAVVRSGEFVEVLVR